MTTIVGRLRSVEELTKLGPHAGSRVCVQRGERFVEEEERRVARKCARECDSLTLSAGEVGDARTCEVVDAETLEQDIDACSIACSEAHVADDVEVREQRVLLEEVAHTPAFGRDVDAAVGVQKHRLVERHEAALRSDESRDDAKHGCLPGPRRPDESKGLPSLDGQVCALPRRSEEDG